MIYIINPNKMHHVGYINGKIFLSFNELKRGMSVMFILIGVSLLVALGFLIAYLWSVKNGQYEDDYAPAVRILFDDGIAIAENENSNSNPDKNKNSLIK